MAASKERRELVGRLLGERPYCEACRPIHQFSKVRTSPIQSWNGNGRPNQSVDIHELVNRSQGGSISYLPNLLSVCRFPCHSWITTHPYESELLGLHLPRGRNDDESFEEAARVRNSWAMGIVTTPEWYDPEIASDYLGEVE